MISPFLAPPLPKSPVSPLLSPCPPTHPFPLPHSGFAEYCFTESFQNKEPQLENIILSEVTQTQKMNHGMHSLIRGY